jgi:hypothetical protein
VTRRSRRSAIAILAAVALLVAGCGGDDADETPTAAPPASENPLDGGGAAPPSAGQLPQEFIDCMAEQGYDVESQGDIHSAPQVVLQQCFGAIH